ncbi:hypothetical protein MKFW12EY_12520 [Methylomonas koyamae]|nr:hypothetical protein MKFW12EY_12520 [Methylomonas koyamae]
MVFAIVLRAFCGSKSPVTSIPPNQVLPKTVRIKKQEPIYIPTLECKNRKKSDSRQPTAVNGRFQPELACAGSTAPNARTSTT